MAAKKAKTTRKYRQAKTAAKPAAKAAFPGKVQASKRDPKLKISAEDRIIAKEVSESAKADLGKNAYLKKSDYEAQQKAAREKFRESMREEGLYPEKETKPTAKKPVTKKATVKKAAAKPAAAKPVAPAKSETAPKLSKSAANKAAWAKMTPEERKNWNANKPGAKPSVYEAARAAGKTPAEAAKAANPKLFKAPVAEAPAVMPKQKTTTAARNIQASPEVKAAAKRPTDASLRAKEDAYLKETKARLDAKKPTVTKPAGKAEVKLTPEGAKIKAKAPGMTNAAANSIGKNAKPTVANKAKATAKAAVKGSKTVRASKFVAKKFPLAMLAGEVGSVVKGSTVKDLTEINRLKKKLGDKPMSAKEGAATQISNLANLASMGLVGKTRRQRMDELNAKIKKAEAKKASQNKGLRYGPNGESLVPGTAAYKAGSKTRPSMTKPSVGGGGSTTRYTVKKGDTLSGIAKNAGLTLSEVRAINPELMKNPKYKKGSMIWSGTKVNIKKK